MDSTNTTEERISQIKFLKEENSKLSDQIRSLHTTISELERVKVTENLTNALKCVPKDTTDNISYKLEKLHYLNTNLEGKFKAFESVTSVAESFLKNRDVIETVFGETLKTLEDQIRQINLIIKLKGDYLDNIETLHLENNLNKEEILKLVEEMKRFRDYYSKNTFRVHLINEENKLLKAYRQVSFQQVLKNIFIDNDNVTVLSKALKEFKDGSKEITQAVITGLGSLASLEEKESLVKQVNDLKKQIEEKQNERRASNSGIDYIKEYNALRENLSQIKEENKHLIANSQDLSNAFKKMKEEKDRSEKELKELKELSAKTKESVINTPVGISSEEKDKLTKEIEELKKSNDSLKKEISTIKNQVELDSFNNGEAVKKQATTFNDKIRKLEKELADTKEIHKVDLGKKDEEISKLIRDSNTLKENHKKEISKLEADLSSMKATVNPNALDASKLNFKGGDAEKVKQLCISVQNELRDKDRIITELSEKSEVSKKLLDDCLIDLNETKKNNDSMLKQLEFTFSQNINNMKTYRIVKEYTSYYKTIYEGQLKERDDFIEVSSKENESLKQDISKLSMEVEYIKFSNEKLVKSLVELQKDADNIRRGSSISETPPVARTGSISVAVVSGQTTGGDPIESLLTKISDLNKSVITSNSSNQSELVVALQKQKLNELAFHDYAKTMDEFIKKIRFGSNERMRNMHNIFTAERTKVKNLTKEKEELISLLKTRDGEIEKNKEEYDKLEQAKIDSEKILKHKFGIVKNCLDKVLFDFLQKFEEFQNVVSERLSMLTRKIESYNERVPNGTNRLTFLRTTLSDQIKLYNKETTELKEIIDKLTKENFNLEENLRVRKEKIKTMTATIKEYESKKKKKREEELDKFTHKLPQGKKKRDGSSDSVEEKEKSAMLGNKLKDEEIRDLKEEILKKQDEINDMKVKEKGSQLAYDQKLRELLSELANYKEKFYISEVENIRLRSRLNDAQIHPKSAGSTSSVKPDPKETIKFNSISQKILLLKAEKSRIEQDIESMNIDLKRSINDKSLNQKAKILLMLKEENHLMKLELNKIKKKNDLLEKDLMEIRRAGEEACKSDFSSGMSNFYQKQLLEMGTIKKEYKELVERINSIKNVQVSKQNEKNPYLKALEVIGKVKDTVEMIKGDEINNSSLNANDSFSLGQHIKLYKRIENNILAEKKTKEWNSKLLQKKRDLSASKKKKQNLNISSYLKHEEHDETIRENFIIDSPISMLRYCKSSKGLK